MAQLEKNMSDFQMNDQSPSLNTDDAEYFFSQEFVQKCMLTVS